MDDETDAKLAKLLRSARGQYNGGDQGAHRLIYDELGVLRRDGGGRVTYRYSEGQYYSDRFPALVKQPSELLAPEDEAPLHAIILLDPEWEGFSFCGFDEPRLSELDAYFDRESNTLSVGTLAHLDNESSVVETRRFLVRDEDELLPLGGLVGRTNPQMGIFLDEEGYFFPQCCYVRG